MQLLLASLLFVSSGGFTPTLAPNSGSVTVAGVYWENSLNTAKMRAKREGKPILLLQMFGKLDDDFC